jgi:hypothetical protein
VDRQSGEMDVMYSDHSEKIRSGIIAGLIFFLIACRPHPHPGPRIIWEKDKAVALQIFEEISYTNTDSILSQLQIRLNMPGNNKPVLGTYIKAGEGVIFRPLIPFTRGLNYQVFIKGKQRYSLSIPMADKRDAPTIVAVYPSADTLPENLLKFYIGFSRPMKQGEALRHILLIKNEKDTVRDVFLDLQPELWNNEQTVLTLWLDPGRIKRDLQPNKNFGNPLSGRSPYRLLIQNDWEADNGLKAENSFEKKFHTYTRDSISPDPLAWKLAIPASGSTEPLTIAFNETLDYFLLKKSFRIKKDNKSIEAAVLIKNKERMLQLVPQQPWTTGKYILEIAPEIEDLAGNNLDHLFDRDLMQQVQSRVKELSFEIR